MLGIYLNEVSCIQIIDQFFYFLKNNTKFQKSKYLNFIFFEEKKKIGLRASENKYFCHVAVVVK